MLETFRRTCWIMKAVLYRALVYQAGCTTTEKSLWRKLHEYDMQVHLRSVGHIFLTQGPVSFLSGFVRKFTLVTPMHWLNVLLGCLLPEAFSYY